MHWGAGKGHFSNPMSAVLSERLSLVVARYLTLLLFLTEETTNHAFVSVYMCMLVYI